MNDQLESFFKLNSKNAVAEPATVFIYGLNDPTTGKCRYIGQAVNPNQRFKRHLNDAALRKTRKDNWICSLTVQGLLPTLEIIDEVPRTEWGFWEREYIRVFRLIGVNLTNLTDGGEGTLGNKPSKEAVERIAALNRGKKMSVETREKMRQAGRVKVFTAEHRFNLSQGHAGKKASEKTREKLRASWAIRELSPETREKLRFALARRVVVPISQETREKLRIARAKQVRGPLSEEQKKKISESLLNWHKK